MEPSSLKLFTLSRYDLRFPKYQRVKEKAIFIYFLNLKTLSLHNFEDNYFRLMNERSLET